MNKPRCRHPANILLPWFVNRSLQHDELEWVRGHVETCPVCASECKDLACVATETSVLRFPIGPKPLPPAGRRRWAASLPWLPAVALVLPALIGVLWIYLGPPGSRGEGVARLRPALYLDLGPGPVRSAEPLKSMTPHHGIDSIVISWLLPLTEEARLGFDLEGPLGEVLIKDEPIRGVDSEGRCSFSFPATLFELPGDYTIIVREETPAGEARLYPYPFRVGPRSPSDR